MQLRKKTQSTELALKTVCNVMACFLTALFFTSCGGSPPDPKLTNPQWTFAPHSIKLRYRADDKLNEYDGVGHSTLLCIYQLSDPNGFVTLSKTSDGLLKLLECKNFDATVVWQQRVFVQPGEDRVTYLDRAEKATFIGIAAGYNQLVPEQSTRVFEFPVVEQTKGVFTSTTFRQPGKVFINIFLGPYGLQRVGSE